MTNGLFFFQGQFLWFLWSRFDPATAPRSDVRKLRMAPLRNGSWEKKNPWNSHIPPGEQGKIIGKSKVTLGIWILCDRSRGYPNLKILWKRRSEILFGNYFFSSSMLNFGGVTLPKTELVKMRFGIEEKVGFDITCKEIKMIACFLELWMITKPLQTKQRWYSCFEFAPSF